MKNSFNDDIERAERRLLIISWLGVVSALAVMIHSIWSI